MRSITVIKKNGSVRKVEPKQPAKPVVLKSLKDLGRIILPKK